MAVGYFLHFDIILQTKHGRPESVYLYVFQYEPLTEAGVEGGPRELCILTPGNRNTRDQQGKASQNNERSLSASLPIYRHYYREVL